MAIATGDFDSIKDEHTSKVGDSSLQKNLPKVFSYELHYFSDFNPTVTCMSWDC